MKKFVIAAVVVVVLAVAGVVAYAWWSDDNAPAELSLDDRPDAGNDSGAAAEVDDLDGDWRVAEGSEVGYRVVEDFIGGLADSEAVGRTEQVTGSLTIAGSAVTAAEFEVDMASVESDRSQRDGQFRGRIMAVDEFPTATFELTEPIELGPVPPAGTAVDLPASGELTLRGRTEPVELTVEARLDGGEIAVAGEIGVTFADYGIPNPSNAFVSTRDHGTIEFLLVFDPA